MAERAVKLCRILCALLVMGAATTTITLPHAHAAKILGLFAHASESHFAVMRGLALELARRGHNVTLYSSHRLDERVANLTEIVVEPAFAFWRAVQEAALGRALGDDGLQQLSALPAAAVQRALGQAGGAAVQHFLGNGAVQQLLQRPSSEFDYDLLIVDLFYTDALLALGHAHRKPTVAVVSANFEQYMEQLLEQMLPIACSPIDYTATDSGSTADGYWQRLRAVRGCVARRKQFAKWTVGTQEQLIRQHFGAHYTATTAPTIGALQSQLALLLLNNHVPLARPRPLLANTLYAGGLHVRAPRELPWHVRRFLDESRIGVIYVNLGDEQLCGALPAERRSALYAALGARREHVLWTCHDVDALVGLPANFMLQHMVPQTDILAHPHVRAFISNGDLLAVQEAILRHVPLLALPLFRHELHNVAVAERLGIALRLDYGNCSVAALAWALETLLGEQRYERTVRAVSQAFRDRPLGALETSMYWIDYVLRHEGGAALKTAGVGMASSQLHLFDLFAYYAALASAFGCLAAAICYAIYRYAMHRQQQQHQQRGAKLLSKAS